MGGFEGVTRPPTVRLHQTHALGAEETCPEARQRGPERTSQVGINSISTGFNEIGGNGAAVQGKGGQVYERELARINRPEHK